MRRLLLSLLAGLALPAAAAGGWCVYERAFPALPCADGWAACRVGGAALGGGTTRDAAGRPLAADARIGWFDLEPAPAFSPFTPLSTYAGAPSAAMATMLAPGPAAPPAPPAPVAPTAPDLAFAPATPVAVTPPRPVGTAVGSPVSAPVAAPVGTPVSAPPPVTPSTASGVPASTVLAPVASPVPVVAPPPTGATPTVATPPTTAVIRTAATPAGGCADLIALEPQAMVGGLSAESVRCIEGRIDGESVQTTRDKLSRLLILNAEGTGNKSDWERLVKRHLEEIDRSDPDLCFKYAVQLSRGGAARALGVIRWADTALENKHRWEGATYKKRVFDLHRLRAEAAGKLWAAAEAEYTTGDHTAENEAKSERYRGMAKDYAREWLDYANASGQEAKNALALCVSASGNRSFCEGGG